MAFAFICNQNGRFFKSLKGQRYQFILHIMVVKLLGLFWLFTSFFNEIREIYLVMPGKNEEK